MGKRFVVDSNMMQSAALHSFLAEAPDNFAILPEFAWFEIYKQGSLAGLRACLSIIGRFPDQLLLLKPWHEVAAIEVGYPDLVEQMIIDGAGADISQMMTALALAEGGEPGIMAQLSERWSRAAERANEMLEGAEDIAVSLPELAEMFSSGEIQLCRTNGRYSQAMFEKIFGAADQLYEEFSASRGVVAYPIESEFRHDSYLYRLGLAIVIYSLWWIRTGSQTPKRLDRLRNDIIDLNFAICGTYFTGLMTQDAKAGWMFHQLGEALEMIRAIADLRKPD